MDGAQTNCARQVLTALHPMLAVQAATDAALVDFDIETEYAVSNEKYVPSDDVRFKTRYRCITYSKQAKIAIIHRAA